MRITAIIALGIFGLSGCASMEAYQAYQESFEEAAAAYYLAAAEPLVDITLPSPVDGEVYHLIVNRDIDIMAPQQIKDSEWVGPVRAGIGAAGIVWGIYATGSAIEGIASTAAGVTVTGNNNQLTDVGNITDNSVFQTQLSQTGNGDNNNPGKPESSPEEPAEWELIPGCSSQESFDAGRCGTLE